DTKTPQMQTLSPVRCTPCLLTTQYERDTTSCCRNKLTGATQDSRSTVWSPVLSCRRACACRRIRQARREGMDFVALVDQVIALLRQRGRVTYRTLQRQCQLDADARADLLGELRYTHQEALREDEQGLIWLSETRPTRPAPYRPAGSGAQ